MHFQALEMYDNGKYHVIIFYQTRHSGCNVSFLAILLISIICEICHDSFDQGDQSTPNLLCVTLQMCIRSIY